jgi:hypothetical protein
MRKVLSTSEIEALFIPEESGMLCTITGYFLANIQETTVLTSGTIYDTMLVKTRNLIIQIFKLTPPIKDLIRYN